MTARGPSANGAHASAAAAANKAAAAGAAAGAASGAASARGFQGWWNGIWAGHSQRVQGAVTRIGKTKFVMPVDVKIDFIQPAVQSIEDGVRTAWLRLPPPVQQAAPYLAVAVGSGAVVYAVQQRRLAAARDQNAELRVQLSALGKERTELLQRVSTLKASRQPRSKLEAQLASAVAEATNAAAAAAGAAARAATACIIQRPA